MATNYSQKIKTNIEKLGYETTQAIYECINKCCAQKITNYNPSFDILYNRGNISCSTDTYDEFIRDAYGLEIEVISIRIIDYKTDISFNIGYYISTDTTHFKSVVEISINSKNINNISTIVPEIEKELLVMDKQSTDKQKEGTVQLPSIQVNVGGDLHMAGSAIGTQNTTSTNTVKKDETSSKSSWWTPIWQNITANIIWELLVLGAIIILFMIYFFQ